MVIRSEGRAGIKRLTVQRILMRNLIEWKDNPAKKPLIVRGVRQCGKTYLLKEFGRLHYDDTAYFSFEDTPALGETFERDLHPKRIIKELSILRDRTIEPQKTLIIFDEIQLCGKALTSLKYFCENAPDYHVVCAGSLLGVALTEKTSFPVGKVEFLTLRPLNFYEFLLADGKRLLAENLREDDSTIEAFAHELREKLLDYYIAGGMPEAVTTWIQTGCNLEKTGEAQQRILDSYEVDFVKHAPAKDFPKLSAIWRSIPGQLAKENSKFIFSQVKDSWRAKDLEDALEWLIRAGLAYKVEKIEKPFIPLSAYADHTFFKLYMCDVGLLRKMSGLPPGVIYDKNKAYREFKGALAENYVLCELMNQYRETPFYWKSGNKAEVDFIVQDDALIIPVEVKSDRASHARSITEYCKKYEPPKAFVTSMEIKDGTIPLFMMWKFRDYARA
jgi:predicted AAA+ superfamily ATPase